VAGDPIQRSLSSVRSCEVVHVKQGELRYRVSLFSGALCCFSFFQPNITTLTEKIYANSRASQAFAVRRNADARPWQISRTGRGKRQTGDFGLTYACSSFRRIAPRPLGIRLLRLFRIGFRSTALQLSRAALCRSATFGRGGGD
jgi:hypothetical protein